MHGRGKGILGRRGGGGGGSCIVLSRDVSPGRRRGSGGWRWGGWLDFFDERDSRNGRVIESMRVLEYIRRL